MKKGCGNILGSIYYRLKNDSLYLVLTKYQTLSQTLHLIIPSLFYFSPQHLLLSQVILYVYLFICLFSVFPYLSTSPIREEIVLLNFLFCP